MKKYEIVGYNKKPKRMSIIDILKKRNIDIISEKPFKTSTFLDKVKNAKKKKEFNQPKLNLIEEQPELQETEEGVKFLIFSSSTTSKKKKKKDKWRPKEFELSKEANINLKGYRQLMSEERERERLKEMENSEKKTGNKKGIEDKKRKVNSNHFTKSNKNNNLSITQNN